MTVSVTFVDKHGEERVATFPNEYLAMVFWDGLNNDGRDRYDDERAKYVASHPDNDPSPDYVMEERP